MDIATRFPKSAAFCRIFIPFLIFLHFAAGSTLFAKDKGFWVDETFGIEHSVMNSSVGGLLVHGANAQASPAPLYYLLFKGFRPFFDFAEKHSIPRTVSWRWISLGSLLVGCLLFLKQRRAELNVFCAWAIICLLLYSEMGFYYSAEARPYELWTVGSLLMLCGILPLYQSWWWTLLGFLMGATTTAVIFQFSAIAAGILAAHALLKRPIPWNAKTWSPVILGFGVALYYALCTGPLNYSAAAWGKWSLFFDFFVSYKWVMFGTGIVVERAYRDKDLKRLCLYLSILAWFLMSPLIFEVTRYKSFFFTPRQYIYWTPATAFVIVGLAQDLFRKFSSSRRTHLHPVWGITIIVFYLSMRPTHFLTTVRQINLLISNAVTGERPQ